MSYLHLHLLCLALIGLASVVFVAVEAHKFGLEMKRDRAESKAFYARMRRERFDSMTAAEQDACRDWI